MGGDKPGNPANEVIAETLLQQYLRNQYLGQCGSGSCQTMRPNSNFRLPPGMPGQSNLLRQLGQGGRPQTPGHVREEVVRPTDRVTHPTAVYEEIGKIRQEKHGFTTIHEKDKSNPAHEKITTTFDKDRPGVPNRPPRVYEKVGSAWFYIDPKHPPKPGEPGIRMQGDLRMDAHKKEFTQVLRSIKDSSGHVNETTRTMDVNGTDTINRKDGKSIFQYDDTGKMTKWTETDSKGNPLKLFDVHTDSAGRLVCKNAADEIRYNPYVEDNGSVTYKTPEDLKQDSTQVVTSSGDRLTNGQNGVKYAFNFRGDVTGIKFPQPRLFEGRIVSEIDIAYHSPDVNQGQIIDSLFLKDSHGQLIGLFQRERDEKDPKKIVDIWKVSDVDKQKDQLAEKQERYWGDFAIKNGLISTTEPLPHKDKAIDIARIKQLGEQNPNYKKAIDDYQTTDPANKDKYPAAMICTYKNSEHTGDTAGLTRDRITLDPQEKEVAVFKGTGYDIPVLGEASYNTSNSWFPVTSPEKPTSPGTLTPTEAPTPTGTPTPRAPLAGIFRPRGMKS